MKKNTKWIPLFATNFLGVFNNNFFQTLICLFAIHWVAKEHEPMIVPLAMGLYVISYIFFSPVAGRLAKTYQKKKIIIVSRMFEIIMFIAGSAGFYFENVYVVMICMFLLGLISTLFSPAKYGLIRDIGGNEGISFGTGALEMFTFFGALLGPLVATIISDHYNFYIMSSMFLVITATGLFSIFRLKVTESEPMKKNDDTLIPFIFEYKSFQFASSIKGLNLIVLGLGFFWMTGSFIRMIIIAHCPKALEMTNTETGYVLTASAIGIGLGSYLAGIFSKGKVELGLTPIGGFGMIIPLLLLYFLNPSGILFTVLIFFTALFCGIYMVPLSASVQSSVEGRKQGDMIAFSNFVIFSLIFISAALFGVITKYFSTHLIFIVLVCMILVVNLLMLKYVPCMAERMKKMILKYIITIYRFFLSLRYKVEIKGGEIFKSPEAKLFLPNHQALVDPQITVTHIFKQAPVVPVATEQFFKNPLLRVIFKALGAVPVSDLTTGSRDMNVLNTIFIHVTNALRKGGDVILYPSGQLTGQGYEKIFNKQSAWVVVQNLPGNTRVIGVRISGLWGSMWSKAWNGKSPDFMKTYLKAVFYTFANLLFFLPKRKVTIEFIDITDIAKNKAAEGRVPFNHFLEELYNRNGEEQVRYLKHFFYTPELTRRLPEKIEGSVADIIKQNQYILSDITDDIFNRVRDILVSVLALEKNKIHLQANLSLDLTIDSLGLVSVISAIESAFNGIPQFEITHIKTVADLCFLAMGKGINAEDLKPSFLHNHIAPLRKVEVSPEATILDQFIDIFSKNTSEPFAYDKMIGCTRRKDFLLKAMVVSRIIRKEVEGQYVGIMLPAMQSTTLLVISTYLAGKIPVMLNWTVGKKVLDHCIENVQLMHILTAKTFYNKVEELLSDEVKKKCIFFEQKVAQTGIITKLSGLSLYFFRWKPRTNPDDVAVILFTSGSESLPKTVPLTHRNIVSNLWGAFSHITIHTDKIIMGFLPPFHSFGFTVSTILPLISGLKVAYTPDPTDSREVLRILKHTHANTLLATPTFLKMLLAISSGQDLMHVELAITGAESLHSSIIESFHQKTSGKAELLEGYGITECSPVLTLNPQGKQKQKSVGKFIKGVDALIADINHYSPLKQGQEGMIMVRGNSIFNGYPDKKIESPFVSVNDLEYYKTGDLGYMDEEGYLFITGRLKRFIKIGGEMISLPAIENSLLAKYGSEEKLVLAVEGNDKIDPPQITLFTTEKLNLGEVNSYLKEKGFSNLVKIHKMVEVEEIPLLGTGKTDYKVLKNRQAVIITPSAH